MKYRKYQIINAILSNNNKYLYKYYQQFYLNNFIKIIVNFISFSFTTVILSNNLFIVIY